MKANGVKPPPGLGNHADARSQSPDNIHSQKMRFAGRTCLMSKVDGVRPPPRLENHADACRQPPDAVQATSGTRKPCGRSQPVPGHRSRPQDEVCRLSLLSFKRADALPDLQVKSKKMRTYPASPWTQITANPGGSRDEPADVRMNGVTPPPGLECHADACSKRPDTVHVHRPGSRAEPA